MRRATKGVYLPLDHAGATEVDYPLTDYSTRPSRACLSVASASAILIRRRPHLRPAVERLSRPFHFPVFLIVTHRRSATR